MERSDLRYQAYVEILKEELIPAMGCTEPIALAYAAAKAREVLGMLPESVQLQVSGSIIKNVKSVQRQKKVNLRWGQDRFCIGRYRNRQRAIGRNDILW